MLENESDGEKLVHELKETHKKELKLMKLEHELEDIITRGDVMEMIDSSKTREELVKSLELHFEITQEYRDFVKNRNNSVYRMENDK